MSASPYEERSGLSKIRQLLDSADWAVFPQAFSFLHCRQGGFHLGRSWSILPKEGREVNLYGDHGARPSSQLALSSFEFLSLKPPIFEVRRYE